MTDGDDEGFVCLKQCDSDMGHLNKVQSSKTLLWISNNNFCSECSLVFCKNACKIVEGHQHNHKNTGDKCETLSVKGISVVRRWEGCPFSEQEGAQKSSQLETRYVREHLTRTLPMTAMIYCSLGRAQETTYSN